MSTEHLQQVGDRYHEFLLTKIIPIPDLDCTLRELVHEPSGALVMHIENKDPENLFCLSFRTLPTDSKGAAHILEHTVLCGSLKYPVKDPFFSMSRRSLNTFMNALTGADFTCYPAASQVEKDFYNLLNVYIDAVFHPALKELSFLQEGHRLSFSEKGNLKSPLLHKGIVYNEMKGSLASLDSRLWHTLISLLMPDLPYAYNSGGDPKEIPLLTYEELREFHKAFYHPSRCLFFFYGNWPLSKHLDFIEDHALKNIAKSTTLPPIPPQKRFSAPKRAQGFYPTIDPKETKSVVSFGFLTAPLAQQNMLLALQVLDCALMDTDASPLKSHLLQSGLCVQIDALLDLEMSEVPYVIVCKGCASSSEDKIEETLFAGLKKIAEEGIPRDLIEAAIHQIELSRSEITTGNSPFGLTLFMRSALAKQHGCPPEHGLSFYALFEHLLKELDNKEYFSGLIYQYFIDNPHFVRLTLEPDAELLEKEDLEEKKALEIISSQLSLQEKKRLSDQEALLKNFQEKEELQDIDLLPKVHLSDIPLLVREFPLEKAKLEGLKLIHHATFTNHILYADLFFFLPQIDESELPYLQLLLSILPELGCGKRTYIENLKYLQAHTGGIQFSLVLYTDVRSKSLLTPLIHLHGKALSRKKDKLLCLFKETLDAISFGEEARIKELISQVVLRLENRLPHMAIRYALLMAQGQLSQSAAIEEICHGLPYFSFMKKIESLCETDLQGIIKTFKTIYEKVFQFSSLELVYTCDATCSKHLQKERFYGLPHIKSSSPKSFINWSFCPQKQASSQGRIISSQVAFNAESFVVPSYLHQDAPFLHVASKLFENIILHRLIREQKGAYGSGSSYGPLSALFTFYSHRDPHIVSTKKAFRIAIETVAAKKFVADDLEEAKLGLIQDFDLPISPGSRALVAYTWEKEGKTTALRQHYRDAVLHASIHDVATAVQTHLLPQETPRAFVSFAGKELLLQEQALFHEMGEEFPIHTI